MFYSEKYFYQCCLLCSEPIVLWVTYKPDLQQVLMIRVSVMMHIVYKNIRSFFTQLINVNNQDFVAVIESLNALLMKTMEK